MHDRESRDDCARTLVNIWNSHDPGRKWTVDDIARAHRLGRRRKTRYDHVHSSLKFVRSRDKRTLIANSSKGEKHGKAEIRMDDDLTPKQRSTLKDLRDDGFSAFSGNEAVQTNRWCWWLFPRLREFWENVRLFIPRLCRFFF